MLQRIIEWTTTDWALKLIALALAFLLWTTVQADAPGQWTNDEIAVRVQNTDGDWVVSSAPSPAEVTVVFRGPTRELLRAASDRPTIIVPINQVGDSSEVHVLRPNWVIMPPGTESTQVVDILPSTVRLEFDRVDTRLLPVAVQLTGEPPAGFELAGPIEIDPLAVRASGAGRNLASIDSLRLPPIDLREHRSQDTLELTIDTVGTSLIISPRTVRVILPMRPILADTSGAGTETQRRD